ncbi:hypothetical protein SLA2020_285480 [Shorea laevis]
MLNGEHFMAIPTSGMDRNMANVPIQLEHQPFQVLTRTGQWSASDRRRRWGSGAIFGFGQKLVSMVSDLTRLTSF